MPAALAASARCSRWKAQGGICAAQVESAERAVLLDAEEAHPPLRDQLSFFVAYPHFPHLACAPARDGPGKAMQLSGAHGTDEGSVVLQADHALPSRVRDGGRADRGERLDHAAMHPAVHDTVALVVLFAHGPLAG